MPQTIHSNSLFPAKNVNAVGISVTAFGLLCGLTGMIAGIFEILQGNLPVETFKISTTGSAYSMFEHDTYLAYTLLGNYLLTGIVTIIVSLAVIIWSIFFIDWKYGGLIFYLLSIIQLLTGGGFVIDLATITFVLSFGINSKLSWWNKIFHGTFGQFLKRLWFPGLLVYAVIALVLLMLTITGVNSNEILEIIVKLATLMFIPILLMIFGGIAYNVNGRADS